MVKGKTILITGSSRGIGAATAQLAKEYGATVILHGHTKTSELQKISKELNATYITCDVTDSNAVRSAIKKIKRLDVLINCAGMSNPKPFLETTVKDWQEVFNINVIGTVNFCQAILPKMQKQKNGVVVNISSVRGYTGGTGRAAYSASKAAIINLTASLAREFGPHTRINAVAPGFTETDMSKTWSNAVWKQAKSCLLGRTAKPSEIAEAILFLASDKASFITGQTLLVDGGFVIGK